MASTEPLHHKKYKDHHKNPPQEGDGYPQFHGYMEHQNIDNYPMPSTTDYPPNMAPAPTTHQYPPPINAGYMPPPVIDPKGGDYVVVYPNQQMVNRSERVGEIDGELNSGFLLYKCWLWVCVILSVITLASNIAGLAISASANEISDTLIPDIVGNSINCIGYFLGLNSIKSKSFIKNQIFKGFLIFLMIFDLVMLIIVFTTGRTPKGNEGIIAWIFIIFSLCFTFLINLWLLFTTDKIGKLLNERKNLVK